MAETQSKKPKILIIDDQEDIRALIGQMLGNYYELLGAEDVQTGVDLASRESPDLILLDIHMPDVDGFKGCEMLRSNALTQSIPVLMLSAEGRVEGRVRAFNLGADDFLQKPIDKEELLARVSSKLRRKVEQEGPVSNLIEHGNLKVDLDRHEVRVGDTRVDLTSLELRILRFILMNREKVMDRDQFLKAIWPGTHVNARTVDTHISSIRRKLAGFDHEIVMLYGAGYTLRPREKDDEEKKA